MSTTNGALEQTTGSTKTREAAISGARPARIRVLVVDDHTAVRAGIESVLEDEPDLIHIGGVPKAEAGFNATRLFVPDVVVLDYSLPDQDGLTLARRLKELPSAPRILIYSAYADAPVAVATIVAGAEGILSKASGGDGLRYAIRAVARGCAVRPPIGAEALRAIGLRLDPGDAAILGMLFHRIPPSEIARVLGITEHWLDVRRWAMLKQLSKLGPP